MKYIASTEYYPNCPSCDGGFPVSLQFFNSLKELLEWSLKNIGEYGITDVYLVNYKNKSAKLLEYLIQYEYGRHSVTGIKFEYKGLKLRTIDNGSGKKVWVRE